jgi:hypothetical protein
MAVPSIRETGKSSKASSQANRAGGRRELCCFGKECPLLRNSALWWCKGSYIVAKYRGEVLADIQAAAVIYHTNMRNWLFGVPRRIFFSKKTMSTLFTFPFSSLALFCLRTFGIFHSNIRELMHSSPNACIIIARYSVTFSEISTKSDSRCLSDQSRNSIRPGTQHKVRGHNISTSTQLHEHLYTEFQDILYRIPLLRPLTGGNSTSGNCGS